MPYYIPQSNGTLKEVAHDSWHAANHPDVEYWEKSPYEEEQDEHEEEDKESDGI